MQNREIKRFGRYEIVGELGRGAMGVVYKARDPQIDRLVALKTILLQGQEQDEEYRQRFFYEAQAAGRLHHPGIVAIFDAGQDPESHNPYIVLEYVTGESLNRILSRQKKLPLADALRLSEEIASALDYAHAQGVVHRDIKPANILITADGHAKIADLGIAKLNLAQHTLPGRVVGTPAFMAPEQLSGERVDGRADLFSLGVILYSMVTGHSPFPGSSATTVCFKVVNREPVPVRALVLDLPRALDAVISRAIAKDPNSRYQRGSDFAADLQQLQQQQPGSTTTSLNAAGSRKALAAVANRAPVSGKPSVYRALREAPLRGLIVGAALMLLLVLFAGNPFERFAPSRKAIAAAQTGPPFGPNPPREENLGSAQPMPETAALPAAPPSTHSTAPAVAGNLAAKSHQRPNLVKSPPRALPSPSSASLDLAVRHQFRDAILSLWIDDKLTLTRPLHGIVRKHLIVFNGVHGANSETVQVPSGAHVIRLRAQSADQSIDLSKTISVAFTSGDTRTLQVTFNNHNTAMNLAWQ
ncbi:MAG TPA: protein kinase [Candidatus Sulfotelmatobacter sp.]|nr:protein kinase [Candidatus Sulfotelmatobacter sp.]